MDEVEDAAAGTGQSLYPLHRTKTLHLVRHAQGLHNEAISRKDPKQYFDPQLTHLGWKQVENLRNHIEECGLHKKIQLVVTSPLLRTIQTAIGVFGGREDGRPTIENQNSPPFIAVELCRELLGVKLHEKRRSVSEYQSLFPTIDFSLVESDEDILWKPDIRETRDEIVVRGQNFFNWLWTRKEEQIAIVTHFIFLFENLRAFCSNKDCHPSVTTEISARYMTALGKCILIGPRPESC
ncbi:phosphoglycerate mutase-like protein 1 isoform X2 [Humulus lupulus]|uniref:phosphoglycerate mutase-like protein 1 isoform X2 n=1 Tax=Humulus lupulus TaxID=3486 RepID=UPI002B40374F|nr:phosphoglycerate mutase-like protein 1 isoform X2 [Humulus lupulus]